KQGHRMPLSRKPAYGVQRIIRTKSAFAQILFKFSQLLSFGILSMIKKINDPFRLPLGNVCDRIVGIIESFLRVHARGDAVANGNAAHSSFEMVFRNLKKHVFAHSISFSTHSLSEISSFCVIAIFSLRKK